MLHIILSLALAAAAAQPADAIANVRSEAPAFSKLVPAGTKIQVLADGFTWAEGPVWIPQGGYLLFSDPPTNRMYRWAPGHRSASVFLEPSGGSEMRGFREAGSNGLKLAGTGHLLVADHRGFHSLMDVSPTIRMRIFEGLANKIRSLDPGAAH